MITVGFTLIGRGNWTGGETYLRNTIGVVRKSVPEDLKIKLFLSPNQKDKVGDRFDDLLDEPPIIHEIFDSCGRGKRLAMSFLTGRDAKVEKIMKDAGVDAVFETGMFFGRKFGIPTVAWIPDFQHRHLAHLFSKSAWFRRDIGFRAQINSGRVIMLSSEDTQNDCENFYRKSRGSTAVVRFAIDFELKEHLSRKREMMKTYDLPQRYFYLPNQFWKHKNHPIVIDALCELRARSLLDGIPPIVLTGLANDPRDNSYFPELMKRVESEGLKEHFRYLGLIPYRDVFGLAGTCDALINPSLFEGWSTTVEEAKGLGAPLILSDINIHREQKPDATFFDPADASALADILQEFATNSIVERASLSELQTAQDARLERHGVSLKNAFKLALEKHAS